MRSLRVVFTLSLFFFVFSCREDVALPDDSKENIYSYISALREVKNNCPDVDKIAKKLMKPATLTSCGSHNYGLLREITHIKPGGGYHISANATNCPLKVCQDYCLNRRCTTSYCSGATYTAFIHYATRLGVFEKMSKAQLQNFKIQPIDNIGFWGLWNNSKRGVLDANHYIRFGKEISSIKSACPGDIMKFDRYVKGRQRGHSAVFLGISGGKYYYWSSNSKTNGYGIYCESLSDLITKETFILRLTNPHNLKNIKNFTGKLLL